MEPDEHAPVDWVQAAEKVERLVRMLVDACAMELSYELHRGAAPETTALRVEFHGPDAGNLTARNAELLRAMESIAVEVVGLAPDQHDQLSFDAEGYKGRRADQMRRAAEVAVETVRTTGRPYSFPPMNSRERRMLHLQLASSGLRTASSGDPARRFVVLYPAKVSSEEAPAERENRLKTIRNAFRPR